MSRRAREIRREREEGALRGRHGEGGGAVTAAARRESTALPPRGMRDAVLIQNSAVRYNPSERSKRRGGRSSSNPKTVLAKQTLRRSLPFLPAP